MAIARQTDASLVKPASDICIMRRYTTSEAIEAGMAVYLDGSGYITKTNAAAVATNFCVGLAVEDIASGGRGDVCVFGPLVCCTGGTPGALAYTKDSTDVGEFAETAGTKTCIVGVVEAATVIFVNPQMVSLS